MFLVKPEVINHPVRLIESLTVRCQLQRVNNKLAGIVIFSYKLQE